MRLSCIPLLNIALTASFGLAQGEKAYDTVVVGAGWAGLTAARALDAAGYNYMVLEARDRVGGRSFTSHEFGDSIPQDMGSYGIASSATNPVWAFLTAETNLNATMLDFTPFVALANGTNVTDEYNLMMKEFWYPFYGDPNDPESYKDSYYFLKYNNSYEENYDDDKLNYFDWDVTVKEIIDEYISYSNITGLNLTLFNVEVEFTFTSDYAGNTTELSMVGTYEYADYDGPSYYAYRRSLNSKRVNVKQGLGNLAIEYANPVMDRVQLNSVVKSINYSLDPVEITYELNGVETVVKAATAIVTVPVGVLKAGDINFIPALKDGAMYDQGPYSNKEYALEKIGPGKILHCALYWENMTEIFWPDTNEFFEFEAPEEYLQGRFTLWVNFYKFNGNKPVIMGTVNGDHVDNMMNMTDEEVAAEAVAKLRSVFGASVPDPTKFIVQNWLKDEFSKSAYSYNIVDGFYPRATLSRPLPGDIEEGNLEDDMRLHFAGEATSEYWYGSIQGAVFEGDRAAGTVISVLKHNTDSLVKFLECLINLIKRLAEQLGSLFG